MSTTPRNTTGPAVQSDPKPLNADSTETIALSPDVPLEPYTKFSISISRRPTNLSVLPIPPLARYDPDNPVVLTYPLNFLMASAATFTVANLYYSQPILVALSEHFNVTYDEISLVPTLNQAGYAIGILLISPLGDLLRRRSIVLLIFCTATLSIGLALTTSLVAFEVLGFFIAILTVTPQIMIPLTADLAREDRRASAIAITLSGLTLGVLVARVLSGVITNFKNYKYVYWMAVGVQVAIWILLYVCLPDFPAKTQGVSYFQMLWSMATYLVKYPLLIQCCLIGLIGSGVFQLVSVTGGVNDCLLLSPYRQKPSTDSLGRIIVPATLSFLLADPPYGFNPFQIGLFGLVGILGVFTAPFTGRLIDHMVGWLAQLVAICIQIAFQAIAVGAADRNVGAVVVVCWGFDVGLQMSQVALSTRIYRIKPEARARLNAIFIISLFIGQSIATPTSTRLYTKYGWHASSSMSLGLLGLAMLIILVRGPHTTRWFGWQGGSKLFKEKRVDKEDIEKGTDGGGREDAEGALRSSAFGDETRTKGEENKGEEGAVIQEIPMLDRGPGIPRSVRDTLGTE